MIGLKGGDAIMANIAKDIAVNPYFLCWTKIMVFSNNQYDKHFSMKTWTLLCFRNNWDLAGKRGGGELESSVETTPPSYTGSIVAGPLSPKLQNTPHTIYHCWWMFGCISITLQACLYSYYCFLLLFLFGVTINLNIYLPLLCCFNLSKFLLHL